MTNRQKYREGMADGVPIALGYFAVAFTLGIVARNAGFSALQAAVCKVCCLQRDPWAFVLQDMWTPAISSCPAPSARSSPPARPCCPG